MSVSKVVRVEEVTQPSGVEKILSQRDLLQQGSESIPGTGILKTGPLQPSEIDNGGGSEMLEEEAKDKVYPLPDNWPKIAQLERRRSCELTSSSVPCVRKAISHLELIQSIIDEWFRRTDEEIQSKTSSQRESFHSAAGTSPKKQLRFVDDRMQTASSSRRSHTVSASSRTVSSQASSASLSVKGIGGKADHDEELDESQGLEIPYLGAEDVISEVITLLARLENDRREKEENFKQEKEKVVKLSKKIDDLCLRRLRDLPVLVQREHEACILDLNELQWHVAYRGRNETRIKNRMDIAEVLNTRLKEDISFVKKHIPLVQEKLQLEVEAMDKIKRAQAETDQELEMTKQRQAKTEQKSEEAVNKAETERGHIKRELDTVRDNLSHISEELSEAKMTYNAYIHQVNDIQQQLKDNAQEMKVLEVKNENAKVAEEMQATKVRDLQSKITEEEFEHRRLESENAQLKQEFDVMKNTNTHKKQEFEHWSKQLESKLRNLLLKNQEANMETQDCEDSIADCLRQKKADEKNIVRIGKETERTEVMMNATMEEFAKVSSIHQHIQDQLRSEQEKAYKTEESLKNTADTLRRQVKDEIHTRTVIQARINSDNGDIEKTRIESAKKKTKAQKIAEEVGDAVNTVLEKVQKLRDTKDEKIKHKINLQGNIEQTKEQHKESQDCFMEKITHLEPHHSHLKEDCLKQQKRLDHMEWKTELMNKKMEDMEASQAMMKKVGTSSEKAVRVLTDDLYELNIQLEDATRIEDNLRKSLNEVVDRLRENESNHRRLLEDRKEVLKKLEGEKKRCLYKNKDLASQYRQLQNEFIIMKESLLRSYEERVKMESSITDVKQLQSLQKKMHGALTEYFKLSGLYNESELVKLERESSKNSFRVSQLQDEMDVALKSITDFLYTQMNGSQARKMAWESLKRQDEAAAKDKQTPLPGTFSRQNTLVTA